MFKVVTEGISPSSQNSRKESNLYGDVVLSFVSIEQHHHRCQNHHNYYYYVLGK